ncbi:hypothetical protein MMC25_001329 [Agyrium rufum]|nr:hypothetical protein [Agyrium rufum]
MLSNAIPSLHRRQNSTPLGAIRTPVTVSAIPANQKSPTMSPIKEYRRGLSLDQGHPTNTNQLQQQHSTPSQESHGPRITNQAANGQPQQAMQVAQSPGSCRPGHFRQQSQNTHSQVTNIPLTPNYFNFDASSDYFSTIPSFTNSQAAGLQNPLLYFPGESRAQIQPHNDQDDSSSSFNVTYTQSNNTSDATSVTQEDIEGYLSLVTPKEREIFRQLPIEAIRTVIFQGRRDAEDTLRSIGLSLDGGPLERPNTPPNSNSISLPLTPNATPSFHNRNQSISNGHVRTAQSSPSRQDPNETIKASHIITMKRGASHQDSFDVFRQQLEGQATIQSPPNTAPIPSGRFFEAHGHQHSVSKIDFSKIDFGNDFDNYESSTYSSPSQELSPHLSYETSPEMADMDFFDDLEMGNINSESNTQQSDFFEAPTISTGMSFNTNQGDDYSSPLRHSSPLDSAPMSRTGSTADTESSEVAIGCMVPSDITTEEISAFCGTPLPNEPDQRWRCLWDGCKRRFGRKENARAHIQTHLDDRQFACNFCDGRFVRAHDLKRHSKIHTGDKPHECPCGQRFNRHDALTRHRQRRACVGAIDGVPKPKLKRGRPKKAARPEPEARAEKAEKTRQRAMAKARAKAEASGSAKGSSSNAPSSASSNASSPPAFNDTLSMRGCSPSPLDILSPLIAQQSDHGYGSGMDFYAYSPEPEDQSPFEAPSTCFPGSLTLSGEDPFGLGVSSVDIGPALFS